MLSLTVENSQGETLTRFSDFFSLLSKKIVNDVGYLRFTLPLTHPASNFCSPKNIVRLYRKEVRHNLNWMEENIGIILDHEYSFSDDGIPLLSVTAYHPNVLLSTRVVGYTSGVIGRSAFYQQKSESIAKALVIYNATTAASLDAHRLRGGAHTLYPLQVQASTDKGCLLDFFCPLQPLLAALKQLSRVGSGDFNIVYLGAGRFEFRWYDGQMGNDLSSTILFSHKRGNISSPHYVLKQKGSVTVGIAAGHGAGALREFAIHYGQNYSQANDIESIVLSKSVNSYESLAALAQNHCQRFAFAPSLNFNIIQTPSTFYGKHYQLGDLVSVHNPFNNELFVTKVSEVTIKVSSNTQNKAIKKRNSLQATQVSPYQKSEMQNTENISICLAANTSEKSSQIDTHLIHSIEESLFDESTIINTLDADGFNTLTYAYSFDSGFFSEPSLSEPIDGSSFVPLAG